MAGIKQGAGSEILAERHRLAASSGAPGDLKDILIVEDSRIDGNRLEATLHLVLGRSITIRRAETLTSAVDCVLEQLPDVVFLDDYLKPNDTASQTIPYLRRAGYTGHIVVISGEVDRSRRQELIDAGASDALHKDDVDSSAVSEVLGRIAKLSASALGTD